MYQFNANTIGSEFEVVGMKLMHGVKIEMTNLKSDGACQKELKEQNEKLDHAVVVVEL